MDRSLTHISKGALYMKSDNHTKQFTGQATGSAKGVS